MQADVTNLFVNALEVLLFIIVFDKKGTSENDINTMLWYIFCSPILNYVN